MPNTNREEMLEDSIHSNMEIDGYPDCHEFVWSCLAKQPQERLPLDCLLGQPLIAVKQTDEPLDITELNVALPVTALVPSDTASSPGSSSLTEEQLGSSPDEMVPL
ncbi:unnamed protein product [Gadus morhua 'NCC']